MHELGIVMQVIDQVEKAAVENNVQQVRKLSMEVGEVSSVVPALFTDCFDWAKKKTRYLQEAELEIILLERISYCQDCRQTYKTTAYARQCPRCGSHRTYLVTGNEINIKDMEVIWPSASNAAPSFRGGICRNWLPLLGSVRPSVAFLAGMCYTFRRKSGEPSFPVSIRRRYDGSIHCPLPGIWGSALPGGAVGGSGPPGRSGLGQARHEDRD